MLKIAKVAVEGTLYHFDMEFDYIIPENIDTHICIQQIFHTTM